MNLTPTQAALLRRGLDRFIEDISQVLESDAQRVIWLLAQLAARAAAESNDLVAMQEARDLAQATQPPPQYITLAEAAKQCGLKQVTLRYHAAHGDLPATKRGGRNWWIDTHDLAQWISISNRKEPTKMYVIAYRKQIIDDTGQKRLSPWPSFYNATEYETKEEAQAALEPARRIERDGVVYFGGIMNAADAARL